LEEACDKRNTKGIRVAGLESEWHPRTKCEQEWCNNLYCDLDGPVAAPRKLKCVEDASDDSAEEHDGGNERQLHVCEEW
jgi:hypothetical protein